MDKESINRLYAKLRRALGRTICEALDDQKVVEIMVNPDGRIWIEKLAQGMYCAEELITPANVLDALGTMAALLGTAINPQSPILEGELPIDNGSRVEGAIPSIVPAPIITIRKKSSVVFPLSDYVEKGKLSREQHDFVLWSLKEKKNILVSGGTGTGKTTFCNALLSELCQIAPNDRVVIIEDTAELQCNVKNFVPLHTCGEIATLNKLLRTTMRLRPDRIVVGEVRGGEALDLLKSWNTGHPGGFATVHANSALSALTRLEQLISEVSASPMKELVAEAVDIVIHLKRGFSGPTVEEIIQIDGIEGTKISWQKI